MPKDLFAEKPAPKDLFAKEPSKPLTLKDASNVALDFMSGVNEGVVSLLDMPIDAVNAVLQLSGMESRVPSLKSSDIVQQGITGGFIEDPNLSQAVKMAGSFSAPAPPIAALSKVSGVSDDAIRMIDQGADLAPVAGRSREIAGELIKNPSNPELAQYQLASRS